MGEQVLRNTTTNGQNAAGKGLVRSYIGKMTGLSRAQVTRLIGATSKAAK